MRMSVDETGHSRQQSAYGFASTGRAESVEIRFYTLVSLLPTVLEFSQISALRDLENLKLGVALFRRRFLDVRAPSPANTYFSSMLQSRA